MLGPALNFGARAFKSKIGPSLAGGIGGGGLGGFGSLFDDDDDDFGSDILKGAAYGAGGVGLGGLGVGFKGIGKSKRLGALSTALGMGAGVTGLGTALGQALGLDFGSDRPQTGVDNAVASAAGSGTPMAFGASQGLPEWLKDQESYYGNLGAPNTATKSLSEWMADPELNRIANAQIIAGNAAIMREQGDLRKNMQRDLAANEALGDEYQIQAGAIARENAADTRSIINAADANQRRIDAETDQMHDETGAALSGNEHTRAEHAQQMDAQDARLNEARISDQELLQRLGVSGQELLGELAAAEAAQTKDNAVKIRTSAMDKVTENRSKAKDAWRFEKPTIMGTLAQGAMDREVQQRQLGLQGYQMKMQQAQQMREAQQNYILKQQELGAAQDGGLTASESINGMAKGSGIKVMGPGGQPVELPIWWNSPQMADALGVPEDMRAGLAQFLSIPEVAEQIGVQ